MKHIVLYYATESIRFYLQDKKRLNYEGSKGYRTVLLVLSDTVYQKLRTVL